MFIIASLSNSLHVFSHVLIHKGRNKTHNHIKKEIWLDENGCDSQLSLRVFVTNLRKKLKSPDYIKTHIGIGYRMVNV